MNGIPFRVAWKACKANWSTGHPGGLRIWGKKAIFFFSEDGNGRKDGVPLRALTLPVSIFSC